ncbi:hypothetical protein GCM10009765_54060 [Fodinicola feengrottensis]|uniref:PBP domain-containing protein n=1 Tax=Fodinicola feengrottensis TaxID=435914 RepID=A0ABN2I3C5_9ACTN
MLTIAILGGSVPIVASSPAYAADPTLTIVTAEQKDFANGDTITVAGANFPANTRVELGQCVGTRGYPHGERLWDTETVNAHPYRKKALYCSAGAPTNKQGIGTPYVATTAADGTLLARLVLFRGNGSFPLTSTDGTGTTTVTPAFDAQHPAVLVARNAVTSAITGNIVYASAALTFAPDGTSVCGAGDKDTAVASGGSGSTSVYLSLVTGMCGTGGKGLPVDATESGEVTALQAFQSGQSDLAFSATGFTPPGGTKVSGTRKAVFIPIALQAATIAFAGNARFGTNPNFGYRSVSKIQATPAELADFLRGGSVFPPESAIATAFVTRNAEMPQNPPQGAVRSFAALATADSSTLATTTTFAAYDTTAGHSLWPAGAVSSLPLPGAGVPIANSLSLASNFTTLRNTVLGNLLEPDAGTPIVGLSVTITDTSSASGLGLTPMALQNAAGKFVPPTKESLEAAVPQMTKLPDGTLFPNPKATGDGTYVMPLVLYAVIPADDSAPRRANVVKFLDYALGDGQTKLPVGAYPLPTDVLAAAKKALHSAVSPSPTPKPSNPSNNSSSTPNSTSPTASPTPSPGAGAALAGSKPVSAASARNAANVVTGIPLFGSLAAAAGWLAPIGLALLVVLSSSAPYISSGRPLPGPLRTVLDAMAEKVGAVRRRVPGLR